MNSLCQQKPRMWKEKELTALSYLFWATRNECHNFSGSIYQWAFGQGQGPGPYYLDLWHEVLLNTQVLGPNTHHVHAYYKNSHYNITSKCSWILIHLNILYCLKNIFVQAHKVTVHQGRTHGKGLAGQQQQLLDVTMKQNVPAFWETFGL